MKRSSSGGAASRSRRANPSSLHRPHLAGAVHVSLDEVTAKGVPRPQRRLEVDRGAGLEPTQGGQRQGLVHHLGLEGAVRGGGHRQAGAAHRHRVARGKLCGEPGADAQAGALLAPLDLLDGPDLAHDAGEHAAACTTPAGARGRAGRRPSAPSPLPAPAWRRRSGRAPSPPASGLAPAPPSTIGAMNSRSSSTSPASRNEPARVGPPSSSMEVISRRPSSASAAATRACGSPSQTTTSAPALSRASVRAAGAAGEAITSSGASATEPTSRESSGSRASESKTTRVGWRTRAFSASPSAAGRRSRGEQRVVGERRADPDAHGVALGPPAVSQRPAGLAGDPLRVAARRRHPPVEAEGRLQDDERASRARVLSKRLIQQSGGGRLLAVRELHLDALVAQDPRAAAARLLARVLRGDHDARHPGRQDRVGARRLAALVGAGLERHVERGPRRLVTAGAAVLQRGDLGVADRRARRGSPRRSPRRRAPAPRRPAGWG